MKKRKKKALKKKGSKVMSLQITARKQKTRHIGICRKVNRRRYRQKNLAWRRRGRKVRRQVLYWHFLGRTRNSGTGLQVNHDPFNACRVGEATNPGPVSDSDNALATSLLAVLEQFQSQRSGSRKVVEHRDTRKPSLASILLQCLQAAVNQNWSDEQVADCMVSKIHQHVGWSAKPAGVNRQSFYGQKVPEYKLSN